jgi:hypothetical protein
MNTHQATILTLILTLLCAGGQACAEVAVASAPDADRDAKLYRSPSERREAGLHREVTEWLSISGLAEVETEHEDFDYAGNKSDENDAVTTKTLQIGLEFTLSGRIAAELVFEYELDSDYSFLDEGILRYDGELIGIEAGRLYIPFGEYYSHFVTGPVLEFGETRGNALVIDTELTDSIDFFVYGVEGEAEKVDESGGRIDWGGGFEFASEDESVKVSAGYFSDIADTDELFLEDLDNKYRHRVGGLDAHALIGGDKYEVTAEYIGALRNIAELDDNEDRPWAANIEVAWFPLYNIMVAARVEASDEVPDAPVLQYGVSATWLIGRRINIAVDYLHGKFENDFVFDDDDNEIDSRNLVAAQLSIAF